VNSYELLHERKTTAFICDSKLSLLSADVNAALMHGQADLGEISAMGE